MSLLVSLSLLSLHAFIQPSFSFPNASLCLSPPPGPEGTEGAAESYVVSSDEEEDVRSLLNAALLSSLQASSQAR